MNVKLLAHTKLSDEFYHTLDHDIAVMYLNDKPTDGQAVSLTAIRNCYSPLLPTEILNVEGEKYFGKTASDGLGGSDADRLFRHIFKSKHTSTLEHLTFSMAIEGVSRSLLAQLTRHRHFSFSVESQRYVKFGSDDKSQGFDYVIPKSIEDLTEKIGVIGKRKVFSKKQCGFCKKHMTVYVKQVFLPKTHEPYYRMLQRATSS
jgi:thymidylate synthase (FAD)